MKKIVRAVFEKISKNSILGPFSAQIDPDLEFQILFQKSENDNFVPLLFLITTQNFKKILRAVFEI